MLGNNACFFVVYKLFQNSFQKILSQIHVPSECQTLFGPDESQTVCERYQQTTLAGKESTNLVLSSAFMRNRFSIILHNLKVFNALIESLSLPNIVRKKAKIRNGYNQVTHLTSDTKVTKHKKTSHTREPRGQPFPRLQETDKTA